MQLLDQLKKTFPSSRDPQVIGPWRRRSSWLPSIGPRLVFAGDTQDGASKANQHNLYRLHQPLGRRVTDEGVDIPAEASIQQLAVLCRVRRAISQVAEPRQQLVQAKEVEPQGRLQGPYAAHNNHHVPLIVITLPHCPPAAIIAGPASLIINAARQKGDHVEGKVRPHLTDMPGNNVGGVGGTG